MDNYPEEFTDLQKRPNEELQGKKWNTSFSKLYYELFIIYAVYFKWVLSGGQKNQNRDFIFRLLWQVVWALQLQLYGVQEESCSGMATPDDAPCHVSSKSLCPWCICFCCSTMLRSIRMTIWRKKNECTLFLFCFDYWVEVHKSLILNLWLTNIICFSENPRRNQ